jgi:hypothetical protein
LEKRKIKFSMWKAILPALGNWEAFGKAYLGITFPSKTNNVSY